MPVRMRGTVHDGIIKIIDEHAGLPAQEPSIKPGQGLLMQEHGIIVICLLENPVPLPDLLGQLLDLTFNACAF